MQNPNSHLHATLAGAGIPLGIPAIHGAAHPILTQGGGADMGQIAIMHQIPIMHQGISNFNQLAGTIETLKAQRGIPGQLSGQGADAPTVSGLSARSNDGKPSSAYAARHQAAEQRRRSRINER